MADTSLLQLARDLGSTAVSGMAEKLGVKWPPPPTVSVRDLIKRTNIRTLDSGPVTSGLALGGFVKVVVQRNGDYTFSSHAHDSGFDNIDYVVTAVLMTPSGVAFTFQHQGHTEGTIAGLPFGSPRRDDDFISPAANNSELTAEWDGVLQAQLFVRIDATDTLVAGIQGAMNDLLKAAAAAIGQAIVKGVISLL